MGRIAQTREIWVGMERVWSILANFGEVGMWHPGLAGSFLLEGSAQGGVGARRQCDLLDGKNWMQECVTRWQEGDTCLMEIEVEETSMPLREIRAQITLRALGGGRCEVSMDFGYRVPLGWLGGLLDRLMLRHVMGRNVSAMLQGLAEASIREHIRAKLEV